LESAIGHHLFYNRALADAASDLGFETTILAQRSFGGSLMSPHRCLTVFPRDSRAQPSPFAQRKPWILRWLDHVTMRQFRREIGKAFCGVEWKNDDLIFGQMMTPRHLAAWADWMAGQRGPGVPELFVHVSYDPSRFAAHRGFRSAWAKLTNSPNAKRLRPLTDSTRLLGAYEQLLGRKVRILPHVVDKTIRELSVPLPAAAPVLGVLGSPRCDKGFPVVAAAILATADWNNRPRFIVQTAGPDDGSRPWVERLREARLPHVEIVDRNIDSAQEYAALFACTTVLLLPYRLKTYGVRTSGIFCEALASGRVVVISEQSWMHETAVQSDAAHLAVPEDDLDNLKRAIAEVASSHEALLAKAALGVEKHSHEFSARRFVEKLTEFSSTDEV
jgi:glycosyltransferase involved in cell wall biosynthesis